MTERPAPLVEVHPDAAVLATAVAGELLNRIADSQAAGHVPQVCLTGGTIADAVHREVARMADDAGVDWGAVDFWWGDERYVAHDSPDRNAGQARAAFLDEVGVPAHRRHEMPTTGAACSVEEGARAYQAELGGRTFDVVMLGVGPDGHVASLFPGFPQLSASDAVVGVTGSPKPPPQRISLTFPALNRSHVVWFLASGEAKAAAVARALADEGTIDETPARGVAGAAETTWFLDTDAASAL